MNYTASITDFFKSPKWLMNMLLGGLCILISILGPIVLTGWLVIGFWTREGEGFETFPSFEFSQSDKYLERGLWPFLVQLVLSLVIAPIIWTFMIFAMFFGVYSQHNSHGAVGCFGVILFLIAGLFFAAVSIMFSAVAMPLKLRAALTQDFAAAFNLKFFRCFIALTWVEIILSQLFVLFAGILLIALGLLAFCVGAHCMTAVMAFSLTHLHKQIYALYLSRGGEPIAVSPKLKAPLLP